MAVKNNKFELSYNDICWIVQALNSHKTYYNEKYSNETYDVYRKELEKLFIKMDKLKKKVSK